MNTQAAAQRAESSAFSKNTIYALFRVRLNLSLSVDLREHPIPIAILLVTLGLLTLLYNYSYRTIYLEAGKMAQSVSTHHIGRYNTECLSLISRIHVKADKARLGGTHL